MTIDAPIADVLRAYRTRLGLSRAALARRWDMPIRTLEDWEGCKRQPSPAGPIRRLIELDQG